MVISQFRHFAISLFLFNFACQSPQGVPQNYGLRLYPNNLIRIMPA